MAISSVTEYLESLGPQMTVEEQKRAAHFIDQLDTNPPNADRLTVAIVREAIEAVKEVYQLPRKYLVGDAEFVPTDFSALPKQKRIAINNTCDEGRRAWKWLKSKKGISFLISFDDCLAHNGTCRPEETKERTIEMLKKLGPASHIAFLERGAA